MAGNVPMGTGQLAFDPEFGFAGLRGRIIEARQRPDGRGFGRDDRARTAGDGVGIDGDLGRSGDACVHGSFGGGARVRGREEVHGIALQPQAE